MNNMHDSLQAFYLCLLTERHVLPKDQAWRVEVRDSQLNQPEYVSDLMIHVQVQ